MKNCEYIASIRACLRATRIRKKNVRASLDPRCGNADRRRILPRYRKQRQLRCLRLFLISRMQHFASVHSTVISNNKLCNRFSDEDFQIK